MRHVLAIAALVVGCKQESPATPPAVGGGSATGTGSGSAAPPPAADASAPSDAALPAPDAAGGPPSAITITKQGLSVIAGYQRGDRSDQDTVIDLQARFAAIPGLKVSFAVADFANDREEGYYSIHAGEDEVVQLFRNDPDGLDTRVFGSMFKTSDGIATGDTAAELFSKLPDLACEADDESQLGLLQCHGGRDDLVFVLDARGYKGKRRGALKHRALAKRRIVIIAANVQTH